MSDYPDNYNFEAEGKSTLVGKLVSINNVQAKKYGSDEYVEKFVANIEDEAGTVWAVWLDSAVLDRAFREEARNRKAIGKAFEPNEGITIEYLGKRQGATYSYKDFKVTFEFAAPSVSAFDALAGDVPVAAPDETEVSAEPEKQSAQGAAQPTSPADDDIPF